MSMVRKFKPPNRLAQQMFGRGGEMVKDAIARSESMLDELREEGLLALDVLLSRMNVAYGAGPEARSSDLEGLYALSGQIIDLAGFAPDSGLAEASVSLCELVDGCVESGATDWPSIQVHLESLMLLRRQGEAMGPAGRDAILEGLRAVSRKARPTE